MFLKRVLRFINLPCRLNRLENYVADLAQSITDLTNEVTGVKTTFDTFKTSVASRVTDLQAQIDALKNQTNPDLTPLQTALDGLKSDVEGATV